MKLEKILEGLEYNNVNNSNLNREIEDIYYDSRMARENGIFVAMKGIDSDGHRYCMDAYNRGTRVFLVQDKVSLPKNVIIINTKDTRIALSKISANFFENPSKKMKIIGITGTKGKTTISSFLKIIFDTANINAGVIGTNGIFYNDKHIKTPNTTPESYEIHKVFKQMYEAGVKVVAMEASSIGFMMHRVNDIFFDIAVFTNIAPDHICDREHPTFEHYVASKSQLFNQCGKAIINIDDGHYKDMIKNSNAEILTYSVKQKSDFFAENIHYSSVISELNTFFDIKLDSKKYNFATRSPGLFSVYNSLACIAVSHELGIAVEKIDEGIRKARVLGRTEFIGTPNGATIVLDFAHNAQSFNSLIDSIEKYAKKRLLCLFGVAGGRSHDRRKNLGKIACDRCDYTMVTQHIPDFEDPQLIINDILLAFKDNPEIVESELNRELAINKMLDKLEPGDVLFIAGKGHDTYQKIGNKKIPHNDKKVIKKYYGSLLKTLD